MNQRSWHRRFD